MVVFSDRLKELLEYRHLSYADLARLTGICKGTISNYMKNKYVPKQDKIYIIATACNVSPSWLMGLDVPMMAEKKSDELSETKLALIDAVKQMSDEQAEAFLKFLETR